MHFLDKRVNVICEELKKLKVKQKFEIDNWKYKEGNFIRPEEAEADAAAWEDFDCQHMHWYGKDTIMMVITGLRQRIRCQRSLMESPCGCMCAHRLMSGTTRKIHSSYCL